MISEKILKFAENIRLAFQEQYKGDKFTIVSDEEGSQVHLVGPWFIFAILDEKMNNDGRMTLFLEIEMNSFKSAVTTMIISTMVRPEYWRLGDEFFIDPDTEDLTMHYNQEAYDAKMLYLMRRKGFTQCHVCDKFVKHEMINKEKGVCPKCIDILETIQWS